MRARATISQIEKFTGGPGGYDAGKRNRLTRASMPANQNENAIPRGQIQNLRRASWDLYRNNPHARKICRTLESKTIGKGPRPTSQALTPTGEPDLPFRTRAHQLWDELESIIDWRGPPGEGGQTRTELAKCALRGTILGGEVFTRFRFDGQSNGDRLPRLRIQLIHPERVSDGLRQLSNQQRVWYGIELDQNDRRLAYHVYDRHPSDPLGLDAQRETKRIPAKEVRHIYIADDIDQLRGTPWFSAALLKMRDTSDYEYNELTAAAMAACVVLGYRRSSGQTQLGLDAPDDWDLEDADGNKLTNVQPGMFLDLGRNGDLVPFNPQRPNANVGEFINHMLRSEAAAVPGVKATTLTGDYRRSSFSSERAADNDIWQELESLQEWFYAQFYRPIYSQLIQSGIESGWFDGVLRPGQYAARQRNYLSVAWQGPVAKSINPTVDAMAAWNRVKNGTSSPQREAAKLGCNWQEILVEIQEFIKFGRGLEIPDAVLAQIIGAKDGQIQTKGAAKALAA